MVVREFLEKRLDESYPYYSSQRQLSWSDDINIEGQHIYIQKNECLPIACCYSISKRNDRT
jgi:hypothetical protein